MKDNEFLARVQEKIERLTGRRVNLQIDDRNVSQMGVELDGELPTVILGSNVLDYSGFARMGIEYAVACIRQERTIDREEFHVLLARN